MKAQFSRAITAEVFTTIDSFFMLLILDKNI